jgi:hypothetical protein
VNGRQIRWLVKRDGAELAAQEAKTEQTRVAKLVEMAMKQSLKPRQQAGQATLIGDILAVAKISNPRWISLNGRTTLAYDFAGDPKARVPDPRDTFQNAAKKTEGTIWFDEADRQVARLEVRLDDNFKIGGGLLASVRKGTILKLEQSPVGEGLWMQTANEQYLDARICRDGVA